MSVVLTSFKKSLDLGFGKPYSAAVYQPKGFNYPKLDIWDIRDDKEHWTRPRDFVDYEEPLREYRGKLLDLYGERFQAIRNWVDGLDHTAVLCCWCPYDRAAQRQLKVFGTFVCHTAVMYEVLRGFGVDVMLDDDRKKMVKLWEME